SMAAVEGLTFLQTSRAGHGTQLHYQRAYTDFLDWSQGEKLRLSTVVDLDRALASYLDHLFFDGWNRDQGEKTSAAVLFFHPSQGLKRPGALEGSRAALKGFKKMAPGKTRRPLPKQGVFAIIGAGVFCGLLDFCLGLLVAWDAYLRLPSDLIGMVGGSLVAPARQSRINRWAILLFPEELPDRSKTGHFDEGMVLESDAVQSVSFALSALKARSQKDKPLRPFSGPRFRRDFAACASLAGLDDVRPYQVRRGAASHDVLFKVREFGAVQERLRHLSESSTRRYRKGTRYLAECEKLSPEIKAFGEWVEANLAGLFSGRLRCQ
ncbi:unnamed protein product, partial [Prorocentrum cordatum]